MRNWIPFLLSISIGFVFIVSAITKLFPIEPFEYQFVDIGLASWNTAPYVARFFISIEFLVGFLFVLNLSLRKWTIRLAAFILLVFSTYLLYKIMKEGNVGNCGCFGEVYKMTPLQGLLKNIGLFVAVIALYWSAEKDYWSSKYKKIAFPLLVIGSLVLGFFINPLYAKYHPNSAMNRVNYALPLSYLYEDSLQAPPTVNLKQGKHIVAFLSLTCSHCKVAAKKLHLIQKRNPALPIYLVLNGDAELLATFLKENQVENIPHSLFLGPDKWTQLAGFFLPVIMYVEEGIVQKKVNGILVEQDDMEKWYNP